jgi:hypothetical protein
MPQTKNPPAVSRGVLHFLVTSVVLAEAVSAINRTIVAGTERNLGLYAASCAGSVVHFALLVAAIAATAKTATVVILLFAGRATVRAAAWFVSEPFLCEEILFRSRENEFGAAITAG